MTLKHTETSSHLLMLRLEFAVSLPCVEREIMQLFSLQAVSLQQPSLPLLIVDL
jgi:hypothetical protein